MSMQDDHYAVVTGGGSGIGRGIALALAETGYTVLVADFNLNSAEEVADEIKAKGGEAMISYVDTADRDSVDALVSTAQEHFPRVDVLINSAGVLVSKTFEQASDQDWNFIMSVNLFGIVNCCAAFTPVFKAQGKGHIVNNASHAALVAQDIEGLGLYNTTKHACLGYTESLKHELGRCGVDVSILCAGRVQSNPQQTSLRNRVEKYGGPKQEVILGNSTLPPGMMSAEDCGHLVVDAIREKRFLIVTHPERWSEVEARHNAFSQDVSAERLRQRG